MLYARGSLLGNTKLCLRRNMLWASQRDAGVLNFRAEPERHGQKLNSSGLLKGSPALRSALTPVHCQKMKKRVCLFSCEAAQALRPPQLCSRHGTDSFVTAFMHPWKAHARVRTASAPARGRTHRTAPWCPRCWKRGRTRQGRKQ